MALIGVSGYARIYLQLIRESLARSEIKLVAAVVINAQEEAAIVAELTGLGGAIYGDYRTMLAEERGRIDLCMIPTGIHWHAEMTIAALRAGANVLVEKPLAATLADAEAIARASSESGKFVAVGFQDYYESATQWLKQRVHDGA
ncbi:MAG: Gfo/Idh/MocA family oxidoreductase, partial [Opitutaceae bacterium]|nr:Gfo/Idh/MocA family oxidoreductase [Opitutaceae bacterium]